MSATPTPGYSAKSISGLPTPGPWKRAGYVGHGIWITSSDGSQIAVVYGPRVTPEAEANACLIVAALETLQELKDAARAMRNLAEMVLGANHAYRDEAIKIAERQESVVAKAEGC